MLRQLELLLSPPMSQLVPLLGLLVRRRRRSGRLCPLCAGSGRGSLPPAVLGQGEPGAGGRWLHGPLHPAGIAWGGRGGGGYRRARDTQRAGLAGSQQPGWVRGGSQSGTRWRKGSGFPGQSPGRECSRVVRVNGSGGTV